MTWLCLCINYVGVEYRTLVKEVRLQILRNTCQPTRSLSQKERPHMTKRMSYSGCDISQTEARFIRRTLHEPNRKAIKVDPHNYVQQLIQTSNLTEVEFKAKLRK